MKSEHSSHPDIAAPHTTGNKAAGNEARERALSTPLLTYIL